MNIDPETLSPLERYNLMIACIIPRPIAWISTISPEGVTNLAPFSFFTGITANPMSVCFAPVNSREGVPKDTLINVKATKQFVVNMANEDNAEAMNQTSAMYPYGVSEFEKVGLTPLPSVKVRPPRVKESPVQMECELLELVTLSEGSLGGNLVIGRVVMFHAHDGVWNGGKMRHQDLKAIGRMEGAWYARTSDAFEMARPGLDKRTPPETK
ncbi:MAG: flavin reductase family protein [Elusimicrobia bacterium]|nr:flavin reductase family protein [Elusimicrobiota bacterium]